MVEAEQALLGAIFCNNAALGRVSDVIRSPHFYEPIHAKIFELCESAVMDGRAATPITISGKLPAGINIAGLTGIQYCARLMAEATTVVMARDYAVSVRDAWAARELIRVAREAAAAASEPGASVKAAIAAAVGDMDLIRAEVDDTRLSREPAGEVASAVLRRLDAIRDGTLEPGVSTGLRDLDRAIGGLQAGRLVIVAGRPGMGKSLVGANIARAVASAGYGCVFHSMEMGKEEIGARIVADQAFTRDSPISSKAIFEGALRPQHREVVERAAEAVAALPLVLDTTSNLSVAEIIARARRTADEMKARGQRLHVLVIDYLKFVKASERYRGQRHYEVGEITAGLKALAKDLNICVVLLCQLNRAVETRADKRPELSDLRESGDIEADADVVLLLFRAAYYLKDKTDAESQALLLSCENDLEIIVAKSRMGAVGTVRVFCHPAASAIRNWS
jgi:replicative DNA helicase